MKKLFIVLLILVVEISYAQTNSKGYITNNKSEKFSKNLRSITNIENISLSRILITHEIDIPKSKPKSVVLINSKSNNRNIFFTNRIRKFVGFNTNTKIYKEPSKVDKAMDSAFEGNLLMTSIYLIEAVLEKKEKK
ncbi:MAG: hypothetical protein N4A32_05940 [Marinifilaceae bacterium]|jgi:hypothetical protein|nr:hypothetical protein [Marinifilaceae bacterium]